MSIRFHEFEIRKQCPEVFVIRKTLTEMAKDARLDEVGWLWMANVFLVLFLNQTNKLPGETAVGGRD